MQFDGEKLDKITRGACACNDDKVIFENPLNWTTRSFIFAKQREYENGAPLRSPAAKLSCEAATEENAKRRSFMPRTQVTGKANFSPGITSGLPRRKQRRECRQIPRCLRKIVSRKSCTRSANGYSYLRATIGSTRIARRAGM